MYIKWNMALLSMRADRVLEEDWHFARECRAPRSQNRSIRESYKKEPKVEEPSHKAMMAINSIGWDWSFMAKENEASENQALIAEEVV
ncbi:hypothetical protein Tco_0423581, partial [Tanacetum coccineum]